MIQLNQPKTEFDWRGQTRNYIKILFFCGRTRQYLSRPVLWMDELPSDVIRDTTGVVGMTQTVHMLYYSFNNWKREIEADYANYSESKASTVFRNTDFRSIELRIQANLWERRNYVSLIPNGNIAGGNSNSIPSGQFTYGVQPRTRRLPGINISGT